MQVIAAVWIDNETRVSIETHETAGERCGSIRWNQGVSEIMILLKTPEAAMLLSQSAARISGSFIRDEDIAITGLRAQEPVQATDVLPY